LCVIGRFFILFHFVDFTTTASTQGLRVPFFGVSCFAMRISHYTFSVFRVIFCFFSSLDGEAAAPMPLPPFGLF
jgi:hypothetical protein